MNALPSITCNSVLKNYSFENGFTSCATEIEAITQNLKIPHINVMGILRVELLNLIHDSRKKISPLKDSSIDINALLNAITIQVLHVLWKLEECHHDCKIMQEVEEECDAIAFRASVLKVYSMGLAEVTQLSNRINLLRAIASDPKLLKRALSNLGEPHSICLSERFFKFYGEALKSCQIARSAFDLCMADNSDPHLKKIAALEKMALSPQNKKSVKSYCKKNTTFIDLYSLELSKDLSLFSDRFSLSKLTENDEGLSMLDPDRFARLVSRIEEGQFFHEWRGILKKFTCQENTKALIDSRIRIEEISISSCISKIRSEERRNEFMPYAQNLQPQRHYLLASKESLISKPLMTLNALIENLENSISIVFSGLDSQEPLIANLRARYPKIHSKVSSTEALIQWIFNEKS